MLLKDGFYPATARAHKRMVRSPNPMHDCPCRKHARDNDHQTNTSLTARVIHDCPCYGIARARYRITWSAIDRVRTHAPAKHKLLTMRLTIPHARRTIHRTRRRDHRHQHQLAAHMRHDRLSYGPREGATESRVRAAYRARMHAPWRRRSQRRPASIVARATATAAMTPTAMAAVAVAMAATMMAMAMAIATVLMAIATTTAVAMASWRRRWSRRERNEGHRTATIGDAR